MAAVLTSVGKEQQAKKTSSRSCFGRKGTASCESLTDALSRNIKSKMRLKRTRRCHVVDCRRERRETKQAQRCHVVDVGSVPGAQTFDVDFLRRGWVQEVALLFRPQNARLVDARNHFLIDPTKCHEKIKNPVLAENLGLPRLKI